MEAQKTRKKKLKSAGIESSEHTGLKFNPDLAGGWWIPDTSSPNNNDRHSIQAKEVQDKEVPILNTKSAPLLELNSESHHEEVNTLEPNQISPGTTKIIELLPSSKESKYALNLRSFSNVWSRWKSGSKIIPKASTFTPNQITLRKKSSINHPDFSKFLAWTKFRHAVERDNNNPHPLNQQDQEICERDLILAKKRANIYKKVRPEAKLRTLCQTKDLLTQTFFEEFDCASQLLQCYNLIRKKDMKKRSYKQHLTLVKRIHKSALVMRYLFDKLEKKSIEDIVMGTGKKKNDKKWFIEKSEKVKEEIEDFLDNTQKLKKLIVSSDQRFFKEKLDKLILLANRLENCYYLNFEETALEIQLSGTDAFYQESKNNKLFLKHEFGIDYPENPQETKHFVSNDNFSEIWHPDGYPMDSKDVSASIVDFKQKLEVSSIATDKSLMMKVTEAPPSYTHSISSINYVPERGNNQIKLETDWWELEKMITTDYDDKDTDQYSITCASELSSKSKERDAYSWLSSSNEDDVDVYFTSTSITEDSSSEDLSQHRIRIDPCAIAKEYNGRTGIIPSTAFENVVTEMWNWSQRKLGYFRRLSRRFIRF